MADEGLVRSIVETHDLDPELHERTVGLAIGAIDEGFVNDFDSVYAYIDYLVGRVNVPYAERFALSLDRLITPDSTNTFHDLFGAEDENLATLFEKPDNSEEGLPIEEAISILGSRVNDSDIALMQQLVDRVESDFRLNWSPNELRTNASQIKERLKKLEDKYELNGELIIPRRPIVYVQLNPSLIIKFGRRRYKGNPLAFFLDNLDVYKGMSRTELSEFDSGLYISLIRAKQIKMAIPKTLVRISLSLDQINEVVAAHKTYGGNTVEASENLPYSISTILRCWREAGLPIKERKGIPLSQDQINEIVAANEPYGGDALKASKNLPYSVLTIEKFWERAGLVIRERRRALPQDEINKIVDAYDTCDGNASEASEHLPYSRSTIVKYWKKKGLKIREKGSQPRKKWATFGKA